MTAHRLILPAITLTLLASPALGEAPPSADRTWAGTVQGVISAQATTSPSTSQSPSSPDTQTPAVPQRALPDAAAPPEPSQQKTPADSTRPDQNKPATTQRQPRKGASRQPTGGVEPQGVAGTQDPNACENRAQASAGILDLVDKITAGIVAGSLQAESASFGMKQLVRASGRLNVEDVRGACRIVRSVRNRYRFARKE